MKNKSLIIISFFLAHFLTKSDVPFKKLLTILCCLPIVIPSYVYGMIFVHLLGPRGKVFQILNSWNLIDSFPDLYGFWGATITLTFLSYPYVFLPLKYLHVTLDICIGQIKNPLYFYKGVFKIWLD